MSDYTPGDPDGFRFMAPAPVADDKTAAERAAEERHPGADYGFHGNVQAQKRAAFVAGAEWAAARPEAQTVSREELAAVLMEVYDHGTQPNAFREADEILRRLASGVLDGGSTDLIQVVVHDAAWATRVLDEQANLGEDTYREARAVLDGRSTNMSFGNHSDITER